MTVTRSSYLLGAPLGYPINRILKILTNLNLILELEIGAHGIPYELQFCCICKVTNKINKVTNKIA